MRARRVRLRKERHFEINGDRSETKSRASPEMDPLVHQWRGVLPGPLISRSAMGRHFFRRHDDNYRLSQDEALPIIENYRTTQTRVFKN